MPKRRQSARAPVTASEQRRRIAGGVPVRSSTRWVPEKYAKEVRDRINAAAAEIVAEYPSVSARDASE